MSVLALLLMVLAAWVAIKVVGALLKLAFWALALAALYWFLAPMLGWPWPPF